LMFCAATQVRDVREDLETKVLADWDGGLIIALDEQSDHTRVKRHGTLTTT
jgi:hypothetical protein